MPLSIIDLRPAAIEDAPLVADLDSAISPEDARDPRMMTFWWTHQTAGERTQRLIAKRGGVARMFVGAGHASWDQDPGRFGWVRVRIHPAEWSDSVYRDGVGAAETWLREEGAVVAVARLKADLEAELELVGSLGYREIRRGRVWRLDLVTGRERLLAAQARSGAEMERQGVQVMTLAEDTDPERLQKLYRLEHEAEDDVPKTMPWPVPTFDEWREFMFGHPAHREDRFWIAREGDDIVGLSVIGYPPVRGIPWTSFTATARKVRGRGIARALKYATVAQAIALGIQVIETQNDAENAPILHLNAEMGYEPVEPVIELHRPL